MPWVEYQRRVFRTVAGRSVGGTASMGRFNDLFRRKFSVVTKIAPPLYVGVGPAAKAAVEHYRPYRSTLASLKVRGVACYYVLPFSVLSMSPPSCLLLRCNGCTKLSMTGHRDTGLNFCHSAAGCWLEQTVQSTFDVLRTPSERIQNTLYVAFGSTCPAHGCPALRLGRWCILNVVVPCAGKRSTSQIVPCKSWKSEYRRFVASCDSATLCGMG